MSDIKTQGRLKQQRHSGKSDLIFKSVPASVRYCKHLLTDAPFTIGLAERDERFINNPAIEPDSESDINPSGTLSSQPQQQPIFGDRR